MQEIMNALSAMMLEMGFVGLFVVLIVVVGIIFVMKTLAHNKKVQNHDHSVDE